MVVDTIKENLRINKKVATKKEIIFVEGDVIVPDAKPDVLNVICTSGVVSVYKKEIIDEKIKMEGQIDTYIMYMSDDNQGNIRGINTSLELSEVINISNITSEMKSNINSKIKEIEAKVVNERKISIKATLEISIEFFSEENISIINNLESENEIKMLQEELAVNSLVGEGETKIFTKDNIAIDNADNLIEILKVDMNICNKDIKISPKAKKRGISVSENSAHLASQKYLRHPAPAAESPANRRRSAHNARHDAPRNRPRESPRHANDRKPSASRHIFPPKP